MNTPVQLPSGRTLLVEDRLSGQGGAVVDRNLAVALSELPPASHADLTLVTKGTVEPSRLVRSGSPFLLLPQNAWVWIPGFRGAKDGARKYALKAMSALSARRSVGVVRISDQIRAFGAPTQPVLPNVLDVGFEDHVSGDLPERADGGPIKVIAPGSITSYRGSEHVVEACRELRRSGLEIELEIAGPAHNPATVDLLKQAAAESSWIRLRAERCPRGEVISSMATSSVTVLSSSVEASPISLLEALAVAPGVVATDIRGHREISDGSHDCISWSKDNGAAALAAAIAAAVEQEFPRSPWADAAHRQERHASWGASLIADLDSFATRAGH